MRCAGPVLSFAAAREARDFPLAISVPIANPTLAVSTQPPPTFEEFQRQARRVYGRIPVDYLAGVEGLVIERQAVPHPTIPDVYTLGECATGELDPADDLGVQLRSVVVLYYGSFVRLSELDPEFDWDYEIWETVVHEIRHHRESAAGEDALEEVDYAEDQNFARLEGREFDPFFFRSGEPAGFRAWEVGGEVFVERPVDAAEWARGGEIVVEWEEVALHLPRPDELGDVHFVALAETAPGDPPRNVLQVRQRGTWESLRSLFSSSAAPRVLQSEAMARVERGGV